MAHQFTGGTERWRIEVQAKLDAWLGTDEQSLTFPSDLSKEERRYLHEQAPRLGLVTKSVGTGSTRYITVSKPTAGSEVVKHWLAPDGFATAALKSFGSRQASPSVVEYARTTSALSVDVKEIGERSKPRQHPSRNGAKTSAPPGLSQRSSTGGRGKRKMVEARATLPAWEYRNVTARLVRDHSVVLITGETGCGKSTQVPQFLLDDDDGEEMRIACSQPRRLSAIAVAERVASERGEAIGGSVGYEVRFESCVNDPRSVELVFMTPGVLLRKLAVDSELDDYTHVVLDEVHEEDADTEFLLVACRELVKRRNGMKGSKKLRLVLMSATLAAEKLADYFSDVPGGCPVLSIGGKAFPVSTFYLEDALEQVGRVEALCPKKTTATIPAEMLAALEVAAPSSDYLTCAQCGRTGFRSPEELGDHAAECVGGGDDEDADYMLDANDGAVRNDLAVIADVLRRGSAAPRVDDDDDDVPYFERGGLLDGDEDDEGAFIGDGAETLLASAGDDVNFGDVSGKQAELEAAVRAYQRSTDEESVDVELVSDLIRYFITSSYDKGAVLVFVPGWADIVDVVAALEKADEDEDDILGTKNCHCVALHSSLETSKQRAAFQPPPGDKWKVVVATNVAETSVTIPDVSFVIDCGLEKVVSYDRFLGSSVLRTQRVSQASARQREGRAGRTRPGICFRLWTRRRHKALAPRRKSELLRANLDGLCLRAANLCFQAGGSIFFSKNQGGGGAREFLSRALNPPAEASVDSAVRELVAMGALGAHDEAPTRVGEVLTRLPLSPRLGLAALYSKLLGCASVTVSCVLDAKDPFIKGGPSTASRAEFAANTSSDVVALCRAADGFRQARRQRDAASRGYCRSHGLSHSSLAIVDAASSQVDRALPSFHAQGGIPSPPSALQQHALVGALAAAALYPNVASRNVDESSYRTRSGAKCRLHNSSLAAKKSSPYTSYAPNASGTVQTVVFGALLEYVEGTSSRSGLSAATVSPVSQLSVLLLCHATLTVAVVEDDLYELSMPGLRCRTADRQLVDDLVTLRGKLRAALADFVAKRPLKQDKLDACSTVAAALAADQAALVRAPNHHNNNGKSPRVPSSGHRVSSPPPPGISLTSVSVAPRKPQQPVTYAALPATTTMQPRTASHPKTPPSSSAAKKSANSSSAHRSKGKQKATPQKILAAPPTAP